MKTDAAIIWLTITIFIVTSAFAVTWYNQSQTIALKNRQLTISLDLEFDLRSQIHDLMHQNDSLFNENDSLKREVVYFTFGEGIIMDTVSFEKPVCVRLHVGTSKKH